MFNSECYVRHRLKNPSMVIESFDLLVVVDHRGTVVVFVDDCCCNRDDHDFGQRAVVVFVGDGDSWDWICDESHHLLNLVSVPNGPVGDDDGSFVQITFSLASAGDKKRSFFSFADHRTKLFFRSCTIESSKLY